MLGIDEEVLIGEDLGNRACLNNIKFGHDVSFITVLENHVGHPGRRLLPIPTQTLGHAAL